MSQEASEPVIELYGDDPDHFESMLKYIYTLKFAVPDIEIIPMRNENLRRAMFVIGVHTVTDKYDVSHLVPSIIDILEEILESREDTQVLTSVIEKYYSICSASGSAVGKLIARTTICHFHSFVKTNVFTVLLSKHAVFAAEVAQYYHVQRLFDVWRYRCQCSHMVLHQNSARHHCRATIFCSKCGTATSVSDTWCG
jgi:hypothetical protein